MVRTIYSTSTRLAFVLVLAGLCGACSSLGSFDPGSMISFAATSEPASAQAAVTGGGAPPTEVDCPLIEVQDGTAAVRVGGQTNDSVRYQFDIANTARECHVQGNQFSVKVGVAGHLLIGPAGTPGAYSTQLRVVVRRDSDQKPEVSKAYKIDADSAGGSQAPFQFVSEPIMVPLTRKEADQDYTILVGFDNGHGGEAPKARHKKHRN
jgi:hypothetical protein